MKELDALRRAAGDFALMIEAGEQMTDASEEGPVRLAFGTVIRAAPLESGGELVLLNWEEKSVEATVPIQPRNPPVENDPNPRGNTRGCRGVQRLNGHLIAASYHTLEVYDEHLDLKRTISDGQMVGLHEIEVTDHGTVWVTATAIDAVVEYDLEEGGQRKSFWPREMSCFQKALGVKPLDIDKDVDNRLRFLDPSGSASESHLHLNAVEVHDGSVFALFNAHGVIVNLTSGEVVLRHDYLQGGHNLDILSDGRAIVNDSFRKAVRIYDLTRGILQRSIDLTKYQWVRDLIRWKIPTYWSKEAARKAGIIDHSVAKPLFVRGLVRRGDMLFVGVSPAAILQINWRTGELVDAYQYATNVHVCVHGLDILT
jgi:hypothetical protein